MLQPQQKYGCGSRASLLSVQPYIHVDRADRGCGCSLQILVPTPLFGRHKPRRDYDGLLLSAFELRRLSNGQALWQGVPSQVNAFTVVLGACNPLRLDQTEGDLRGANTCSPDAHPHPQF